MTCLIRTTSELEVACAQVRDAGVLALDTEFDNVEDGSNPLSGGWRWETVGREMAERFGVD